MFDPQQLPAVFSTDFKKCALNLRSSAVDLLSASNRLVKTGPSLNSNSRVFMLKIKPPTMSKGSISGVNWYFPESKAKTLCK